MIGLVLKIFSGLPKHWRYQNVDATENKYVTPTTAIKVKACTKIDLKVLAQLDPGRKWDRFVADWGAFNASQFGLGGIWRDAMYDWL